MASSCSARLSARRRKLVAVILNNSLISSVSAFALDFDGKLQIADDPRGIVDRRRDDDLREVPQMMRGEYYEIRRDLTRFR